jgi:peroxiredoxin Q/BCP
MLSTGDVAPDLTLPNHAGDQVSLADLRGGWVLLYWYPKADTPGCTTQARSLREQQDAFDELGCTVLGASFDTVDELAAFRAKYGLTFDLLSDTSHDAGRDFGVAGPEGEGGYADRVAYLIGPDGAVAERYEVTDPEFFAEQVLDDLDTQAAGAP